MTPGVKRPLALAALLGGAAVAFMVGGAGSSDGLELRLVAETTNTITLGWDPQPGYGYLFSADGTVVSRTYDPATSTVKFRKATSYEVAVIAKGVTGTYPPPASTTTGTTTEAPPPTTTTAPTTTTTTTTTAPPTTTTTPTAAPLFDGRATRMNSITGSTKKVGDASWDGNSNASQDPDIWGASTTDLADGIYCMTDSCSVIPDATFGKVYRFNIGPGDTNPYYNQPTKPNGELTMKRPIAMGQWDWYATAFKIVSPYTLLSFNVIEQFGYPSLSSPPESISFDSSGLGIDRHVGIIRTGNYLPDLVEKPRFWPVSEILDKWVQMVVGIKWAVDNTGEIQVYGCYPAPSCSPTLLFSKANTPTFQQKQGEALKTSVNDKMGLYFGDSSSPPTNTVLQRGFSRWSNKADAIAATG